MPAPAKYLQPFEDLNKRTSRLSANLPLFLTNCAPLSFLDVEVQGYAYAMLAVYERNNTHLAGELFEWTYRRSIQNSRLFGKPWARQTRCGLGTGRKSAKSSSEWSEVSLSMKLFAAPR